MKRQLSIAPAPLPLPIVGRCPHCRCSVFYSSASVGPYCTGCQRWHAPKELFGDA